MIERIRLGNVNTKTPQGKTGQQPSFSGAADLLIKGLQICEKHPMVNVAVADAATAIGPRTIVETFAVGKDEDGKPNKPNVLAGLEAFRRESSGLIVNCLIPSFAALGVAKLFNRAIIGNKSDLSGTWATSGSLDRIGAAFKNADGTDRNKTVNVFKRILNSVGIKEFGPETENAIQKLTDVVHAEKYDSKTVKHAYEAIIKETPAANIHDVCKDTTKVMRGIVKENITDVGQLKTYLAKAKKLVNVKSFGGLAIILPLAISMQPLNRWLTRRKLGEKGAPYVDYKEPNKEEKAALLKQKIVSVGSMIGVGLLSLAKIPTGRTFQFNGMFPTMDQARLISTATFASRMAAAEEKKELREATIRDIATFASFYWLGDYAAKGVASGIEKKYPEIKLLNRTKTSGNKTWNWIRNTALKSTDELSTVKEKRLRTLCQLANIGFSLISLGVFIPLYTRTVTNKKKQAELAKENAGWQSATGTSMLGKAKSSWQSTQAEGDFTKAQIKDRTAFEAFFNS